MNICIAAHMQRETSVAKVQAAWHTSLYVVIQGSSEVSKTAQDIAIAFSYPP